MYLALVAASRYRLHYQHSLLLDNRSCSCLGNKLRQGNPSSALGIVVHHQEDAFFSNRIHVRRFPRGMCYYEVRKGSSHLNQLTNTMLPKQRRAIFALVAGCNNTDQIQGSSLLGIMPPLQGSNKNNKGGQYNKATPNDLRFGLVKSENHHDRRKTKSTVYQLYCKAVSILTAGLRVIRVQRTY
jgi:hypothetical protein